MAEGKRFTSRKPFPSAPAGTRPDRELEAPRVAAPPRLRPKPNATPDDLAFGINACALALETGAARSLFYWAESRNPRVAALVEHATRARLPVEAVPPARLDQLTADGVHQGVLVRLRDLEPASLEDLARAQGPALAVLLDQVTDPQNVGAILRTSVATGVRAVVIPKRRGAHLTPGVHRASAGLSFIAPVAAPQNLALALRTLKEAGFWCVAADAGPGSVDATQFDWPQRTALILGSEGEGVSQLLLRESDFRVALPMDARVESLNVGVAFGALAYLWRRRWPLPSG
ncbi:MAG: 23S rRNA (guanosine(2251)-2'-O)-methyltransferase RlmB [Dehalococcoidia bacterium]